MTFSKELLDEPLKDCEQPEGMLGDSGLMKELKIKLMERMLGAELTAHLAYEEGKEAPRNQSNRRNGTAGKRLKGQDGEMAISVPRDRDGSFEPEPVKKGQTWIDGIDDKIIGLYAAGLTVRDIWAHLEDVYGLKVSPGLISRVTDAVLDEVREWQPGAGADISHRHFRRPASQNPRCRQPHDQEQGRLRGAGHLTGWRARGSGPLGCG